jgi:kynurenine formamidase
MSFFAEPYVANAMNLVEYCPARWVAVSTKPARAPMKIIDMSHVMNVHTPGWVGYAGNKMYYAQNLQTQMIVAQRIDTALHAGTHFDGVMHATDNRKGDMASLPLDYLVNRGVVVDISAKMSDWAVIAPEIIEGAGADIA